MKIHAKIEDHDKGWGSVFKRAKAAKDGRVKVGVLADDSKGGEDHGGLTVAELAVVLHFGTAPDAEGDQRIPARPFLQMAFDQQREELGKLGARLMAEVILGERDQDKALGLLGAKLAAEAKKVITVGNQLAPNAPATVKAKGSDRPLVDTGRLLNAITWAIDKGEGGH